MNKHEPYIFTRYELVHFALGFQSGVTLNQFVEEWRTTVAVNLKGGTTRAAESHLRAHILPKLGSLTLPEINTKPFKAS